MISVYNFSKGEKLKENAILITDWIADGAQYNHGDSFIEHIMEDVDPLILTTLVV